MEQSFIAFLEDSIQKNWDLDALTDYKGATFMGHRTKRFFQWSGKMGERF